MKRFFCACLALCILALAGCSAVPAASPTPAPTATPSPAPTPTPTPDPAIYEETSLSVADPLSSFLPVLSASLLLYGPFEGAPTADFAWQTMLLSALKGDFSENSGAASQSSTSSVLLPVESLQLFYNQYFTDSQAPSLAEDSEWSQKAQIKTITGFYAFLWGDEGDVFALPSAMRQNAYGALQIECEIFQGAAYEGRAQMTLSPSDAAPSGYTADAVVWLTEGGTPETDAGKQAAFAALLLRAAAGSGAAAFDAASEEDQTAFLCELLAGAFQDELVASPATAQQLTDLLDALVPGAALPSLPENFTAITYDKDSQLYSFLPEEASDQLHLLSCSFDEASLTIACTLKGKSKTLQAVVDANAASPFGISLRSLTLA